MIKKRSIGFHAPLTLADDTVSYCHDMQSVIDRRNQARKKGEPAFTLAGNGREQYDALNKKAGDVKPLADRVRALEAELSEAYRAYDQAAVGLWHDFTKARDLGETEAEHSGYTDVQAVAEDYVYHSGRASRPARGTTPVAPIQVTAAKGG
jgi:hypothetical protein